MLHNLADKEDKEDSKMRSSDRILVLKPREGGGKSSTGMTDASLFKGGNKLHAVMNPQTLSWSLRYDQGMIPPFLRCKFTSFSKLLAHAKSYYEGRNIDVVRVED